MIQGSPRSAFLDTGPVLGASRRAAESTEVPPRGNCKARAMPKLSDSPASSWQSGDSGELLTVLRHAKRCDAEIDPPAGSEGPENTSRFQAKQSRCEVAS